MLKRLAKEIKEYQKATLITPIITILEVFIDTLMPLLMAAIIDQGVAKKDIRIIYQIGLGMLVLALIGLCFGYIGGRLSAYASSGYAKNLRQACYEKIQRLSFSSLDKFPTSTLVTRLTTDIHNIQTTYQMMTRMFVRAPANLLISMIMAFTISARLASIYLFSTFFLAIILVLIIKGAMKYFHEVYRAYDEINEIVQENVSAIRVVKAYVREAYETSRFHKAAQKIYELFTRAEKITAFSQPLMQASVYFSILMISWIGAHHIVAGELSTGSFMSLLTYCLQIMYSLMMLGMVFVMISMSSASVRRVVEILQEEEEKQKGECQQWQKAPLIFDKVSFHYPEGKDVLKEISFRLEPGETLGIIGAIGSGKSSLVSLISRFYEVSEGMISAGGRNIEEYDSTFLREKVAMVLQKNELFSGTIYENLRWGKEEATEEECRYAAKIAQAEEFILRFPEAYQHLLSQGGKNVSGGQKQRLCIARALLKNPEILILDDATSALDTLTESKLRQALKEAYPQTMTLIISQRISSIQEADKILVLEDGRMNGFGNHEQLLKENEIYRSLYETQQNEDSDFDERGE